MPDNTTGGAPVDASGATVIVPQDANGTSDSGADAADKTFTQADLDRVVADRVNRERAKYSDYNDLKRFKQGAMSDQEKAIEDAKQAGRTEALTSTGARLARAELKAAAAGRVPEAQLTGFLQYADLSKFVGADGEPDERAIKAAIDQLAPTGRTTNFDGGTRTTAKTTDMNALIRQQAGLG